MNEKTVRQEKLEKIIAEIDKFLENANKLEDFEIEDSKIDNEAIDLLNSIKSQGRSEGYEIGTAYELEGMRYIPGDLYLTDLPVGSMGKKVEFPCQAFPAIDIGIIKWIIQQFDSDLFLEEYKHLVKNVYDDESLFYHFCSYVFLSGYSDGKDDV